MDYFKILPSEIFEEIVDHLNASDIKNASLVSKDWYNKIGESKTCMEKLCLKHKESDNFQFHENILQSNRRYRKLNLHVSQCDAKKNTKYLRIMREIVSKFSESVVSLKISHDLKLQMDLPKLKELEFDSLDHLNQKNTNSLIASNGLITKTKTLEKLAVKCANMDEKSIRYLKDFLLENESLKKLEITDYRIIVGFSPSQLKMKLEELYLTNRLVEEMHPLSFGFIMAHELSLKIVGCYFMPEFIAFLMSRNLKLKTLNIRRRYGDFRRINFLKTNESITNLSLNMGMHDVGIISNLQNLQELRIMYVNGQILDAFLSCKLLKVVKYGYLSIPASQREKMERNENIEFVKMPSSYFSELFNY